MRTIGERIELILEEKSLKASLLAEKIGVSRSTMSFYVHNRTYPSEKFFITIKEVVPSLNLNWLITGEGDKYLGSSSTNTANEVKLRDEIEDLKNTQAQLLKAVSALSSIVPSQVSKEQPRSFKMGVHVSGLRIHDLIEKYTMACTPLAVETARA